MAKKRFGSLDSVFENKKTVNTVAIKRYHSNYDYSDIKEEDKEKLVISEEDIVINRDEINKGYFKIAKNLYEANQILASYDNTFGKFIRWFEELGLKKTFVYNSIKRYELFLLTKDEEKVNKLSQKAVEIIGSKKVEDSLKIELLNEEGIEKKSDRDLKEYILQIISEHSEMIKSESSGEKSPVEILIPFEKVEEEILRIEIFLEGLSEKIKSGITKEQFEKIKKINDIIKTI